MLHLKHDKNSKTLENATTDHKNRSFLLFQIPLELPEHFQIHFGTFRALFEPEIKNLSQHKILVKFNPMQNLGMTYLLFKNNKSSKNSGI